MFITILDLILLLVMFIFISFGFFVGFISMLGSLVGLVIGAWAAGQFFDDLARLISPYLLGRENLANVVSFFLVFTIVNRLVVLAFWGLNKAFKIFSIIPFTKSINRVLGALLGFLEATLLLGLIVFFVGRYNFSDFVSEQLANSSLVPWLVEMANLITPLLPDIVRQLTPVF